MDDIHEYSEFALNIKVRDIITIDSGVYVTCGAGIVIMFIKWFICGQYFAESCWDK